MIYIGQSLNLHKLDLSQAENLIDFEVSCRLWWILVVIDFLEDIQRHSMLSDNFKTPIPRNINDSDLDLGDLNINETEEYTSISYNRMIIKLSRIKKSLYYEDNPEYSRFTLNQLNLADMELLNLQHTISSQFLDHPDINKSKSFAFFLMEIKLAHERLVVNRMIISFVCKETWLAEYRSKCVSAAITVLEKFNNKKFLFHFKKYWVAGEHSINVLVFLIIDLIIHQLTKREHDSRLKLINKCTNILVLLKATHTIVSRGLKIVDVLLTILKHHSSLLITDMADNTEISKTINDLKSMPRIYGSTKANCSMGPDLTQPIYTGNDKNYPESILHDLLYDNDCEQLLELINLK